MTRIRQKQTYGLALQPNSLTVPDGATERLVNVLHQRDGLYIKERGFDALYDPAETIYGIFEYDEYIVVVLNSQIIRIDKFGAAQGSKTSSTTAFEMDGTGRPAPYAFLEAPFAKVVNEQAFFCTPEGVRVMRESTANNSIVPGLSAPIIRLTSTITKTSDNFFAAEGTIKYVIPSLSGVRTTGIFYSNDFVLTVARKNATPPVSSDCLADTAISFKAVLRRVLPNGQVIESPPSSPVFAYNANMPRARWDTNIAGGLLPNEIRVFLYYENSTASRFTINATYTGVIANATSEIYDAASGDLIEVVDSPELNGRYEFLCTGAGLGTISGVSYDQVAFKIVLPTPPATKKEIDTSVAGIVSYPSNESIGYLDFSLDRYSSVQITCPADALATDTIDLYYSRTEIPLSSNPLAVPDGDYYLAKEITGVTAGGTVLANFAAGIFQKGPPLYTNPSDGDRSRLPNNAPPGANCIESWKGFMFYGNTYQNHTLELTHIGGNLTANGTFSIQFTDAGSPENFTFEFIQANADANTIKQRIARLVHTINSTSTNFISYYSNSTIEFPGGITIVSRVPNRGFKVFAASPLQNSFEPVLGTTFVNTTVSSNQEAKRNRIYWSKLNQPEAVPYFVDVGLEDEDILNIKKTRDSLIIVKRDGIFAGYGEPSSGVLRVREIDTTVKGISSTGVTSLGNRVYAKTNVGVVAVSDTGMTLVSRKQVEPLLKVSDEDSTGDTVMYGLEDDRQLYIATSKNPSDSTRIVYSYNALTQSWSEISKVFKWGFVIDNNFTNSKTFQNNRVITDGLKVFIERKDYLLTDFADESFAFTVSSVSSDGLEVTLSGAFTGPVGSALAWDNGTNIKLYRITEINGSVVTLNIPFSGVATDAVTLYTPIESIIRTSPIDGGDSSYVKQFTKFILNARYDAFSAATIAFMSDWFEHGAQVNWTKRDERRGWGQQQWGRFPWGQATAQSLKYLTAPSQIVQTEIPRTQQKSTFIQAEITHNVACEGIFIQQIAFEVDTKSKRPAR